MVRDEKEKKVILGFYRITGDILATKEINQDLDRHEQRKRK